jgi:hypothetical protein
MLKKAALLIEVTLHPALFLRIELRMMASHCSHLDLDTFEKIRPSSIEGYKSSRAVVTACTKLRSKLAMRFENAKIRPWMTFTISDESRLI